MSASVASAIALRRGAGGCSRRSGVMVEPVQGEGGVRPAGLQFLRDLRAACDEFGLLLALELREEKAPDVVRLGIEEGVLLNATGPTTIRLAPPLTLTVAEAEEALAKLTRALERVSA